MKIKLLGSVGVLGIVLLIVALSGCISSDNNTGNNTKNYASDIDLQQTTSPDDSLGYWQQNGWIESKEGISYANITLIATGYTSDNQIIGTDKVFVPTMNNQDQSTGFEAKFKTNKSMALDHMTIQVINATPI